MARRSISAAGKRRAVNTKITDDIRERLEAAAAESDRTLSHEIEYRLENSFASELKMGRANSELLRDIEKLLSMVSLDSSPSNHELIRYCLDAAFRVLLSSHFPGPSGIMGAEFSGPTTPPEKMKEMRGRFREMAHSVLTSSLFEHYSRLKLEHGDLAPRMDETWAQYATRTDDFRGAGSSDAKLGQE